MADRTIFPSAVEVVRRQPLISTVLVALGLSSSVLGLVQPALTGLLVGSFGTGGGVWLPALALGLVFCISAVLSGVTSYVSARITENGVVGIREGAIKRMPGAPVQVLGEASASATASRVVNDPPLLIQGPVSVLTGAAAAALSGVGAALACLRLMPGAFLGAMLCSLAALLITVVLGTRVRDRRIRVQDSLSEFSGDLQTVLESITSIRHYNVTSFFEGDLTKGLSDLKERSLALEPDSGTVEGLRGRRSRGRSGFVDQSATVIKGSIADNVRFRRQGITDDQVCSVLKHVGLHQYANDEGIRVPVQPRGMSLSGGERQRLALARALVGGADTLVLDEPTSNVDGALERHMLDAIEDLAPHATVVVVAHRPATVKRADHLIFLDKGTVKEQGSPLECLSRNQALREVLGEWEMSQ